MGFWIWVGVGIIVGTIAIRLVCALLDYLEDSMEGY
jgi:hypothetical protein